MVKVKTFRVAGEIQEPKMKATFLKEIRALKPDNAVEKIYAELGSRHKVKRCHIHIVKVEEVKPKEANSTIIRKLAGVEK